VECRFRNGCSTRVFAEADGELLGGLPAELDIVPQALTLLFLPARVRESRCGGRLLSRGRRGQLRLQLSQLSQYILPAARSFWSQWAGRVGIESQDVGSQLGDVPLKLRAESRASRLA